jgi:hypothetical protein
MQKFAEALKQYNVEYPESGKGIPRRGTAKYAEICKRAGLEPKEPVLKIAKPPKVAELLVGSTVNAPSSLGAMMLEEEPETPITKSLEEKLQAHAKKAPKPRAKKTIVAL